MVFAAGAKSADAPVLAVQTVQVSTSNVELLKIRVNKKCYMFNDMFPAESEAESRKAGHPLFVLT